MTCKDCVHRNVCKAYEPEEPECFCNHFISKADFVEVVRCKDCKHLAVLNLPTVYAWCKKIHYSFIPFGTDTRTHFCSYGERKEKND